MKRRTAIIAETVKIIINCITIPLYFIKLICEVAVLPGIDENGEQVTGTFYYYYSILDKVNGRGMSYLVWGAIAIIIASIALSVLSMIFKEKKPLKIASHVIFVIAVVIFFVLLFVAKVFLAYAY